MTYRKEYLLGILSLLPLLTAGTNKGLGWLVTIIVVYVGVPVLIWSLVVSRLTFFVIWIIRHFRESSGHMYYFERPVGPPGFSRRMMRDFRVLLFVFVLSATIVPRITAVTPADIAIVSNEFVYTAIFLLAVPSSIHVLFWVLEDSGLRCHNPKRVTVTAPGAWMSNWLASVGSLGAFLTFAISLGGSIDKAVALTTTLFASLLPSCILAPTLFYRRVEPGLLTRVRESKTAMAMARLFAPQGIPAPQPSYPAGTPSLPGQGPTRTLDRRPEDPVGDFAPRDQPPRAFTHLDSSQSSPDRRSGTPSNNRSKIVRENSSNQAALTKPSKHRSRPDQQDSPRISARQQEIQNRGYW